MRPAKLPFFFPALLLIAAGVILALQWQSRARLRDEDEALLRQNQELIRLEKEHRRLLGLQGSAEELNRLRSDRDELRRLRESAALARRQKKEMESRLAQKPADGAKASALIPAGAWRDRGRATPAAALETAWWAAARGDTDTLAAMLQLDPAARAKAEAILAGLPEDFRSQYGTPEKLVALFLAKDVPLGAMHVDVALGGPDKSTLYVLLQGTDGQTRQVGLSFSRQADGWGLVVPENAVEKYAAEVAGTMPIEIRP